MIQLQFIVTVEAPHGMKDAQYLKHLIKGQLNQWDSHAKVSDPQLFNTKTFEKEDYQAFIEGRCDL